MLNQYFINVEQYFENFEPRPSSPASTPALRAHDGGWPAAGRGGRPAAEEAATHGPRRCFGRPRGPRAGGAGEHRHDAGGRRGAAAV